jgi:tRNA(Ile2) C34 agmatinyltransferase TiaS
MCLVYVRTSFSSGVLNHLTRSSRRKDAETGHLHDLVITKEKCEDCHGKLVQTGKDTYTCIDCGLEQRRDAKKESV